MAEEPSSGISTTARMQRERHQTGNGAAEHRPNQKEQLEGGQHEQRGVDTGRSNQYLHMQCLHIKVSPAHANISLNIPAAPLEGLFQGLGFTLNEPGGLPRCLQNPASQFPSSSHPAPLGRFQRPASSEGFGQAPVLFPGSLPWLCWRAPAPAPLYRSFQPYGSLCTIKHREEYGKIAFHVEGITIY